MKDLYDIPQRLLDKLRNELCLNELQIAELKRYGIVKIWGVTLGRTDTGATVGIPTRFVSIIGNGENAKIRVTYTLR